MNLRDRALAVIEEHGAQTAREVAEHLDARLASVRAALWVLMVRGQLDFDNRRPKRWHARNGT